MKIKNIHARETLDSNGNPTISTEIELWSGEKGSAQVPSGASTGKTEVLELRDEDGKGVRKAVNIVNTKIKEMVVDKEFTSQKDFDDLLIDTDGTELKTNLGGNTILSCSMAFTRAVTNEFGLNLYEYLGMIYWNKEYEKANFKVPVPFVLVMEGGKHGNWSTDIQEYMIVPDKEKFTTFAEMLRASTTAFHEVGKYLDEKGYSTGVGFEGAYAPKEIKNNTESFEIILESIRRAGFKAGDDFKIALDIASSEFFNEKKGEYSLKSEGKNLKRDDWITLQREWLSKYPIVSIEDPLSEDDWEGWQIFTEEFGEKYLVVGDDLLTTNVKRIERAVKEKAANAVLVKLNQIGTVTETLDAIRTTVDNDMKAIISHRSGETTDSFIADLVVATPAEFCKFGAPSRGERVAKYNRLLEIEEDLNH